MKPSGEPSPVIPMNCKIHRNDVQIANLQQRPMRMLHSRQFPDTRKAVARRQLLDIQSDSGAIRTRDPQLRRLLLYPAELRNRDLSSERDCKDKQNSLQAASFGLRSCLEIYVDKIQNSFQNFFGGVVNVQVQHEIKFQFYGVNRQMQPGIERQQTFSASRRRFVHPAAG